MVKSEKKKYTKKNISNKVHKFKKNSGTAKKKTFRKSKKGGGIFNNKAKEDIDSTMMKNGKLVKKFIKLEKKPLKNMEEMIEIKNSLIKNNYIISFLNDKKQVYQDTNSLIVDLSLFKIPEQPTATPSSTEKEAAQDSSKKTSTKRSKNKSVTTSPYGLMTLKERTERLKKEVAARQAESIRLQKEAAAAEEAKRIRLQKKAAERKKKAEEAFKSYLEEEQKKPAAKEEEDDYSKTWRDSQSAGK